MDNRALISATLLGALGYILLQSKSIAMLDSIFSKDGYVPPNSDPATTTPVQTNPTKASTKTVPATATKPATTVYTPAIVLSKTRVRANQKVNLRDYHNISKVIKQAYSGQIIGNYLTQKEMIVDNKKSVFVIVQGLDSILPGDHNYYYVLKSAVDIIS